MAAEADQPDCSEHDQPERCALQRRQSLAGARGAEQHERQREASRDLHADARHERRCCRAVARCGTSCQRQRACQREHDQRVVVRAADSEHEQHRVQPDERRRPAARLPQSPSSPRDKRYCAEAAEHGERFERPQPAVQPERHEHIAEQREQRAVWRVLIRPAEESKDFIARRLCCDVRVRVQAVQRAESGKADVAEHVLREQRRAEQQDHVGSDDRRGDSAQRQRARCEQHEHVTRAHDQAVELERARAHAQAEPFERASQPADPAAAARWDVLRRFARRARCDQQRAYEDAEQAKQPERAQPRRRAWFGARPGTLVAAKGRQRSICRRARRCRGDRHRLIVTSSPPAGVWWEM